MTMNAFTFVLLSLCGSLAALQMDKNLQYNCYYQILRQYSTKSYYDYDDYTSSYNARLNGHLNATIQGGRSRRQSIYHINQEHAKIISSPYAERQNAVETNRGQPLTTASLSSSSSSSSVASLSSQSSLSSPLYKNIKETTSTYAKELTYFILASEIFRPGHAYKVAVSIVEAKYPVKVYANITCDGVHVIGDSQDVGVNETGLLTMAIASTTVPKRECALRLEGFFLNVYCDLAFLHEAALHYSQLPRIILIETDKVLYTQGDNVRFRISVITADLKPSDSIIEIYIVDPYQRITRRWLKRLSSLGTVTLEYKLADQPSFGEWTINATLEDRQQRKQLPFIVEEFYGTRFEVAVDIPATVRPPSSHVSGTVTATYTNGEAAKGNLTLQALLFPADTLDLKSLNRRFRLDDVLNAPPIYEDQSEAIIGHLPQRFVGDFNGSIGFVWHRKEFEMLLSNETDYEILIVATVGVNSCDEMSSGYSVTRLYRSSLRVAFLADSPQIFKPSLPFSALVTVTYVDGTALPGAVLRSSVLEVTGVVETRSGGRYSWPRTILRLLHAGGTPVWELKVDLSNDLQMERTHLREIIGRVAQMRLQVRFTGDTTMEETTTAATMTMMATAELVLLAHYSPRNQHIRVATSTERPTLGEYIIFAIYTNFYLESFHYVIMSKGRILASECESFADGMRTIAIVITNEMIPAATIIVWAITWHGHIVVDALTFPVGGVCRNNFSVAVDNFHIYLSKMVKVTITGEAAAYVGLSSIDNGLYSRLAAANILTDLRVSTEIFSTYGVAGQQHGNKIPADSVYYPSTIFAIDANRTFAQSDLLVFTDGVVPQRSGALCNVTFGYGHCMARGCLNHVQKCENSTDIVNVTCVSCREHRDFARYRSSRRFRDYDNVWLWKDLKIGSSGYVTFYVKEPPTNSQWLLSGHSLSPLGGLGVVAKRVDFSTLRPFSANVQMPSQCRRGEHVGIRLSISSHANISLVVVVVLRPSPNYAVVDVHARDVGRTFDRYHLLEPHKFSVHVDAGSTRVVYVPMMALVVGTVRVELDVKTSFGGIQVAHDVHVRSSDFSHHRHQAVLLDLTKQNYVVEYMNFTSITKLNQLYRARISVVGDVVGPLFATMPLNTNFLLSLSMETAEQNAFVFAANLYSLIYLRLTKQRFGNMEKDIYRNMNIIYQKLLTFLRPDGSFAHFRYDWNNSDASVWLTAQCLRLIQEAASFKLVEYVWIDAGIIEKSLSWLLQQQSADGAFEELPPPMGSHETAKNRQALSSHVLITLASMENTTMTKDVAMRVEHAKRLAIGWLERNLDSLAATTQPYEVAITTYALLLCRSSLAEQTLALLRRLGRTTGAYTYWASSEIFILNQLQNPKWYSLPRSLYEYDSLSIETTAYALMCYVLRRDPNMDTIVNWLNANRLHEGGWASTRDTSVALRALIEFAIYSRSREPSAITIELGESSRIGTIQTFYINNSNSAQYQSVEAHDVRGMIQISAKGIGYAILQMHVEDYIDKVIQPVLPAFHLQNEAIFHGDHSSHITFASCVKWLNTKKSEHSGMVILDVTIPTGYGIQQQRLDAYVRQGRVKNLIRAKFTEKSVVFYFGHIGEEEVCIHFTVKRWHPVANISRSLPVRVYDYNAPEHFTEAILDALPLHLLSICDVCGSSKCTNCLAYNTAVPRILRTPPLCLLVLMPFFMSLAS